MKHIRQHALFLITLTILFTLLGFVFTADANPTYTVRTVYFQPTDAPGPTRKIIELLIQSQDFYRAEMERHGYGPKTFKLETDGAGNVGFYPIRGKHNADYYVTDTYNRIKSELPRAFTLPALAKDNVLVIIVSGVSIVCGTDCKRAYGGYYLGDNTGGFALIANEALDLRVLNHEIGHTFGLKHTTHAGAIMYTGSDILLDYEARWLDRHHFFSDTHIRSGAPQFLENQEIIAISEDKLRFKINVNSENGLHQAQLTRGKSPNRLDLVLGTAEIEGTSTTIQVDVDRSDLIDGDSVDIQIMDIHGNTASKTLSNITLPKPVIVDINTDGVVNIQDLVLVAARLGETWDGKEDVNNDGIVNILDLVLVTNAF